jgi:hypothetical protein
VPNLIRYLSMLYPIGRLAWREEPTSAYEYGAPLHWSKIERTRWSEGRENVNKCLAYHAIMDSDKRQ